MPSLDELRQHASEDVRALNPDIFAGVPEPPRRKNKFSARKTVFDGEVFDSAKEARRYAELLFLQSTHAIAHLRRQVCYELQPAMVDGNGDKQRAITYTADFVYQRDGKTIIEDVKSPPTAKSESFRVRWRMLLHKFRDDPSVQCEVWIT